MLGGGMKDAIAGATGSEPSFPNSSTVRSGKTEPPREPRRTVTEDSCQPKSLPMIKPVAATLPSEMFNDPASVDWVQESNSVTRIEALLSKRERSTDFRFRDLPSFSRERIFKAESIRLIIDRIENVIGPLSPPRPRPARAPSSVAQAPIPPF